jgi:hypothetical protein
VQTGYHCEPLHAAYVLKLGIGVRLAPIQLLTSDAWIDKDIPAVVRLTQVLKRNLVVKVLALRITVVQRVLLRARTQEEESDTTPVKSGRVTTHKFASRLHSLKKTLN